jgi:hypothetical protein
MQLVLISLGVLAALAVGLPAFARANPAKLATWLRVGGGAVLSLIALLLLARGQIHLALLAIGIGFPLLLGKGHRWLGGKPKSTGQTSKVATAVLRMQLDHDTGAMQGEVLSGRFAGRKLADLSRTDLLALVLDCRQSDPQSLALMEAYLDNRYPDWRDTMAASGTAAGAPSGAMTQAQARDILGVGPQASEDDIRHAWRDLMKRNHPDQGGSSIIAATINEAKEVLLGKSA